MNKQNKFNIEGYGEVKKIDGSKKHYSNCINCKNGECSSPETLAGLMHANKEIFNSGSFNIPMFIKQDARSCTLRQIMQHRISEIQGHIMLCRGKDESRDITKSLGEVCIVINQILGSLKLSGRRWLDSGLSTITDFSSDSLRKGFSILKSNN